MVGRLLAQKLTKMVRAEKTVTKIRTCTISAGGPRIEWWVLDFFDINVPGLQFATPADG